MKTAQAAGKVPTQDVSDGLSLGHQATYVVSNGLVPRLGAARHSRDACYFLFYCKRQQGQPHVPCLTPLNA